MPMRPSFTMLCGMMPAFAFPGEIRPGQLGPTRRVEGFDFKKVIARIMSSTGMPSVMQPTRAITAWGAPAHDDRPVGLCLLRVKGPLPAGQTLHQEARLLVDEYRHTSAGQLHDLGRGFPHGVRRGEVPPAL